MKAAFGRISVASLPGKECQVRTLAILAFEGGNYSLAAVTSIRHHPRLQEFEIYIVEDAMISNKQEQSDVVTDGSESGNPVQIDAETRKFIDDQINLRVSTYRTWIVGFSYAVGLVLLVLIGSEILTKRGIVDYIRDEIMDYENNTLLIEQIKRQSEGSIFENDDFESILHDRISEGINSTFSNTTSVSYKDQFVIGNLDSGGPKFVPHHSVVFHAKAQQAVEAIIHLRHSGSSDEKYLVKISMLGVDPNICCFVGEEDIQFKKIILSEAIESSYGGALQPEDDLHFLTFDIKNSHRRLNDTIYGTVVIKVIGMEE